MSSLGELYRIIIINDKTCTQFLKDSEVLPNTKLCIKLNFVVNNVEVKRKKLLKNAENVI